MRGCHREYGLFACFTIFCFSRPRSDTLDYVQYILLLPLIQYAFVSYGYSQIISLSCSKTKKHNDKNSIMLLFPLLLPKMSPATLTMSSFPKKFPVNMTYIVVILRCTQQHDKLIPILRLLHLRLFPTDIQNSSITCITPTYKQY